MEKSLLLDKFGDKAFVVWALIIGKKPRSVLAK